MSNSSEDRLLGGRVTLRQPKAGYRAAVDPLLLAAAVPARPKERLLELGCGAGAAFLCLLARVPEVSVTAVERDAALADLAEENAAANGWGDRVAVLRGAVESVPLEAGRFDQAFLNPPYLQATRAHGSGVAARDGANIESTAGLDDWLNIALKAVRPKGRITLIQRADRLGDVLAALSREAGEVVVLPLWPKPGRSAKRILVSARKGVASPLTLAPGLLLHDEDGGYSPEANAVLRDGAPLIFLAAT